MFLLKAFEIFKGSPDAAFFIHLQGNGFFLSGFEAHFSGHVDVPGLKKAQICVRVECFFAAHYSVLVVYQYVMDGLPVFKQRADEAVKLRPFFFRKVYT